jgi:MFS transporter, ACS family, tartrate transporter
MSDDQIFAKCAWRLIPFMVLLYVLNYFDRVNVGFAALTMNRDLGFTPTVFGFGAGLFFVSYALFQIPANVFVERIGARRAVCCILVTWGASSAACAFVQTPASFYALRFLLGVAEAGFFPGMVLYMTYWFPHSYRGRFAALFMTGIPLSFVIGGPLSGLILEMDGIAGLRGWQWLFLLEGLPACILGFASLKLLPDGPAHAAWLTAVEKKAIAARLDSGGTAEHRELWPALRDLRVVAIGLALLGFNIGVNGYLFWLPQIVQGMGFSNRTTSFIVALPFLAGMIAMIYWGRSSDKRGERIWHAALAVLFAAAGFATAGLVESNLLVLVGLTVVAVGMNAFYGPFWSWPSSFLKGPAAAGGIALINAIGAIGGFLGPTLIGVLKEQTGGYAASMVVLAVLLLLSVAIVLALGRAMAPRPMLGTDAKVS